MWGESMNGWENSEQEACSCGNSGETVDLHHLTVLCFTDDKISMLWLTCTTSDMAPSKQKPGK
jgi:hypothetical protein